VAREQGDAVRDPGQRREEPGQPVDQDLGPAHGQAHQLCRVLVATYGIDGAAEARTVEQKHRDQQHHQGEHHVDRDECLAESGDRNPGHRPGTIEGIADRDRIEADEETHAPGKEHACQRGDEGLDLEEMDQAAHGQADKSPHHQHPGDDPLRIEPLLFHQVCGSGRNQRDDSSAREIDAARENYDGLADGRDEQVGLVDEEVGERLGIAHSWVLDITESIAQDEEHNRRQHRNEFPVYPDLHGRTPFLSNLSVSHPLNCSEYSRITISTTRAFTAVAASAGTPMAYMVVVVA